MRTFTSTIETASYTPCAVRVPDHGKLTPWRFILWEGAARAAFGDVIRARWQQLHPDHGAETLDMVRGLFLRAPTVLGVVSTAQDHVKIPLWEQHLSVGAAAMQLLNAAHAHGFVANWLTGWAASSDEVAKALGATVPKDRIAGFFFIGSPVRELEERPRPELAQVVSHWNG